MRLFAQCRWPGNFRQLGNLLRTAAAMVEPDGQITTEHLPDDFFDDLRCCSNTQRTPVKAAPATEPILQEVTAIAITRALERFWRARAPAVVCVLKESSSHDRETGASALTAGSVSGK